MTLFIAGGVQWLKVSTFTQVVMATALLLLFYSFEVMLLNKSTTLHFNVEIVYLLV